MRDHITLTGKTDYHPQFPPCDAKKGYVAKITGRATGARKFEREFMGQEAQILEGDEGLYERQRGDKKGGYTRWYHVILSHPGHGLIRSTDCEDEAPKIAKLMDEGVNIYDAVEISGLRPRQDDLWIFDAVARTKTAAKSAAKSATIESATEACWETLRLLPEKEAKKVLTALRKRVSEPKPPA